MSTPPLNSNLAVNPLENIRNSSESGTISANPGVWMLKNWIFEYGMEEKDFLLQTLLFLAAAENAVIHLLDESRHSSHHIRLGILHIVSNLGYTFRIIRLVTHKLVQVVHHSLIDMA